MVQRGEQRGADVDIEDADILVAGGRGLGKAEGFELVRGPRRRVRRRAPSRPRARSSTPAGTRTPAQIGQTGKTVAPKLYLAAGISGAIQHKVGMQASENIVAINKDANAPIFEFSDLGIVGDLNKILPEADRGGEGARRAAEPDGGSANGHAVVPAAFPPPVDSRKEFIKRELDAEDELIEVGVAIVGGGTAGLACANRLLQLLGRRPRDDGAPRRGPGRGDREGQDVRRAQPVGRGHAPAAAAGAVPRPVARGLARGGLRLRRGHQGGRLHAAEPPRAQLRIPTPPPFKNHGNEVVSVSALARFQQRQAEEGGAYILTETAATQLLVEDGARRRRAHGRQGPRQGRRAAGQLRARHRRRRPRRRCSPRAAGATSPAPRSRSSTSAEGREPQVWELGVKEVWKVPKPLDRLIHTIGPWPLKLSAKYGQIGGTWIYPMKDEKTATTSSRSASSRPRVRRRDDLGARPAAAVQDCTRWSARSSRAASASPGAPRRCPAAATGRCRSSSMPGALLVGDAGGHGRHGRRSRASTTAINVGHARGRGDLRSAQARRRATSRAYEQAIEESVDRQGALRGRATRASRSRRASSRAGRSSNLADRDQGQAARAGAGLAPQRREADVRRRHARAAIPSRTASTRSTSSRASSSPATRRATTRPNHIRVQQNVPREVAETWRWMCPAGVYEIPDDAPEDGQRRRDRQLHQLRAVRRDHGQGRAPDDARGRRRAAVPDHLTRPASAARAAAQHPRPRGVQLDAMPGSPPARSARRPPSRPARAAAPAAQAPRRRPAPAARGLDRAPPAPPARSRRRADRDAVGLRTDPAQRALRDFDLADGRAGRAGTSRCRSTSSCRSAARRAGFAPVTAPGFGAGARSQLERRHLQLPPRGHRRCRRRRRTACS